MCATSRFLLIVTLLAVVGCTRTDRGETASGDRPTETNGSAPSDTSAPSETTAPSSPPPIAVRLETPSADAKTGGAERSFVSTDRLVLIADAAEAEWRFDGGAGGSLEPASARGATYDVVPKPPPAPASRSAPLRYSVRLTDGERTGAFVLEQDEIDTIRQQYIDMAKKGVPLRSEFVTFGRSRRGYFSFTEIQSRDGAPWAVFTALDRLDEWRENYGGPLKVNRGYSTPRHNGRIRGAAKNSQHLYGTAADIDSNRDDWAEKRDAAREAGACTEPLSISGYGHVHADWRKQCPPGW